MTPNTVLLTYLHRDTVSHSFMQSVLQATAYDRLNSGCLVGCLPVYCPSGQLGMARDNAVEAFVMSGAAEWLWIVDSDMGFEPDALYRLLGAADPDQAPVMSALNFSLQSFEPDNRGGFRTMSQPAAYSAPEVVLSRYPVDQVITVYSTGTACLLVHRSVFSGTHPPDGERWFLERDDTMSVRMSEDASFCSRLRELDIPIHLHTGVRTSHHKSIWVSS